MKKFLLNAFVFCTAFGAFGQGQLYVDNTANNNPSPSATANGLFFINTAFGCQPITQDFNLNFYGGTDSASLVLLKSFVGPTAAGGNFGPGWFSDPSGTPVTVPGATTSAFFRIDAWLGGPGSTFATAIFRGSSQVFVNPLTPQPPNVPPTLIGMPAVAITFPEGCPEPSTLALASLAAALLLFRRRK